MTFYRVSKQERFTQIDNRMINDPDISAKAKGILLYLLSKPDGWKVYEVDIINNMKDGRDSVRNGIKELVEAGYMNRHQAHDETGRFSGYNYTVYEYKTDNPSYTVDGKSVDGKTDNGKPDDGKPDDGKTDDGKTDDGKPATNNTNLSNTELNNTNLSNDDDKENPSLPIPAQQNVFQFYEQNFGLLNPYIADDIEHWLKDFDNNEEVLKEAMRITLENQATWSYTKQVLKNWYDRNIRTPEAIEAAKKERERKRGKNRKHPATNGNASAKPNYEKYGISDEEMARRLALIEGKED